MNVIARRGALVAAALVLFLFGEAARADEVPHLQQHTTVAIRGPSIVAEVARSSAEHAQGLGGRDGLAPNTGMVFPYTEARRLSFWMKGMRFDIDIVWIRDGRIVDISAFVPAPRAAQTSIMDAIPQVAPREPADTVLEVVAGTARARGWQIGDPVVFDPPLR
jgi:uncharacterized membrane protein (UPF0127 family)